VKKISIILLIVLLLILGLWRGLENTRMKQVNKQEMKIVVKII